VARLLEAAGGLLAGCWKPLVEGATSASLLRRRDGGPSVTTRSRLASNSRDMAAANALLLILARLASRSLAKTAGAKLFVSFRRASARDKRSVDVPASVIMEEMGWTF